MLLYYWIYNPWAFPALDKAHIVQEGVTTSTHHAQHSADEIQSDVFCLWPPGAEHDKNTQTMHTSAFPPWTVTERCTVLFVYVCGLCVKDGLRGCRFHTDLGFVEYVLVRRLRGGVFLLKFTPLVLVQWKFLVTLLKSSEGEHFWRAASVCVTVFFWMMCGDEINADSVSNTAAECYSLATKAKCHLRLIILFCFPSYTQTDTFWFAFRSR